MNSKLLPLFLALLFLATTFAHAGRDESLIRLTRKNQLAHDAKIKKENQEKARQEKESAEAATAASQPVQAVNNGASIESSIPAKP